MPDDLSKLTVAKLKDALKKRGLDVAGLKADLVARLRTAVDAENDEGPRSPKSPPTKSRAIEGQRREGQEVSTHVHARAVARAQVPRASGGKGEKRKRDSEPSEPAPNPCPPNRRRGESAQRGTRDRPPGNLPRRRPRGT